MGQTWGSIILAVKNWCGGSDERRYLFVYYLGISEDSQGDIWMCNEGAFELFYDKETVLMALKKARKNPDDIEYPRDL